LGTALVSALAQQLGAQVEVVDSPKGLKVTVTLATFTPHPLPEA
jgi:signal transduction histidine kinase